MVPSDLFEKIRAVTHGMLGARIYQEVYVTALTAPAGNFLDIGPAQGGSTIALGLARRDARRSSKIYSVDTFRHSKALHDWDDVEKNIDVLKDNLRGFGAEEGVNVLVAGVDDIETAIPRDVPIGLMFIDADGALDRDFASFYDRLSDNAPIIIDDCELRIVDKYVQMRDTSVAKYVAAKGWNSIEDGCPFGKHYTTFRFMRALQELGLVRVRHFLRNTVFAQKTGEMDYRRSGAPEILAKVRSEIYREFQAARAEAGIGIVKA